MSFDLSVFLSSLTSTSLLQGAVMTVALTIVSFAVGLGIGLLVALLRDHRWRWVRVLAWTYVWVFRAIPTLVQLLFVWNALPALVPAFTGTWFTPFLAAALALALNEGAYAAEIVRGGLLSIDDGQKLAARALGLSPWRTFRRVIAPQLMRVIIPPMSNDFITMLKITSLASVISLRELLTNTQLIISSTFRFAELYAAVAVWYLVLVSIFMIVQAHIERRYVWTLTRAGRNDGPAAQRGDAMSRPLDGDDGRHGQQPPMRAEPGHGEARRTTPPPATTCRSATCSTRRSSTRTVHAGATVRRRTTSSSRATSTSATGQTEVLRGVTFGVHRGDVKAVLGPSGSGKSTLLRCLALLEPVDAGEVRLEGARIGSQEGRGGGPRRFPERQLARQRSEIGMVFQRFNLFPHLTALGNVMIGLHGGPRQVAHGGQARSRRRCWAAWAWPNGPASTRASCPAASSSGWRSPARW